jgi:hypothetical protein
MRTAGRWFQRFSAIRAGRERGQPLGLLEDAQAGALSIPRRMTISSARWVATCRSLDAPLVTSWKKISSAARPPISPVMRARILVLGDEHAVLFGQRHGITASLPARDDGDLINRVVQIAREWRWHARLRGRR